jgi:hypothetical protein
MGIVYYYDNIYKLSKEDCQKLEMRYSKSINDISGKEISLYLNDKLKTKRKLNKEE